MKAVLCVCRQNLLKAWSEKEVPDHRGCAASCPLCGIAACALQRAGGREVVLRLFAESALGQCTLVFTAKVFQFPFYTGVFSGQVSHSNGDLKASGVVLLFSLHLVLD